MNAEYDLSTGTHGNFYRPDLRPKVPVYLDDDVAEIVRVYAQRYHVDAQTVVNQLIRRSRDTTSGQQSG